MFTDSPADVPKEKPKVVPVMFDYKFYGERVAEYDLKDLDPRLSPYFPGHRMNELYFAIGNDNRRDPQEYLYRVAFIDRQWKVITPEMNRGKKDLELAINGESVDDDWMQQMSLHVGAPYYPNRPDLKVLWIKVMDTSKEYETHERRDLIRMVHGIMENVRDAFIAAMNPPVKKVPNYDFPQSGYPQHQIAA